MTLTIPRSKDFWAGVTFILLAALALYFGSDLSLGTLRRMGPRYFPTIASVALIVIGAIVAFKGLAKEAEAVDALPARPVLVLVSVLLFGLLLPIVGLVVATAVLVFSASFASPGFRFVEVTALSVFLAAFTWAIFVWGLSLPLRVWPV